MDIYTDGACSGNPGPGGWAAVLLFQDKVKEVSGFETETTNNRMEMQAVIQGLSQLKVQGWRVRVHTDSAYIANAFAQDWIGRWQRNGWKTSKKDAVLNQELWQEMLRLLVKHRILLAGFPAVALPAPNRILGKGIGDIDIRYQP